MESYFIIIKTDTSCGLYMDKQGDNVVITPKLHKARLYKTRSGAERASRRIRTDLKSAASVNMVRGPLSTIKYYRITVDYPNVIVAEKDVVTTCIGTSTRIVDEHKDVLYNAEEAVKRIKELTNKRLETLTQRMDNVQKTLKTLEDNPNELLTNGTLYL